MTLRKGHCRLRHQQTLCSDETWPIMLFQNEHSRQAVVTLQVNLFLCSKGLLNAEPVTLSEL